jgi:hypothetical protein
MFNTDAVLVNPGIQVPLTTTVYVPASAVTVVAIVYVFEFAPPISTPFFFH